MNVRIGITADNEYTHCDECGEASIKYDVRTIEVQFRKNRISFKLCELHEKQLLRLLPRFGA